MKRKTIKVLVGAAALFALADVANGANACNSDLLTFVAWTITPIDAKTNRMTTTFRSNAENPLRMIDASASYRDALGGSIASFSLERDINVAPGAEFTETRTWGPYTFERLLDLRHDEVETFVCVRAVLYEDGSKEQFE